MSRTGIATALALMMFLCGCAKPAQSPGHTADAPISETRTTGQHPRTRTAKQPTPHPYERVAKACENLAEQIADKLPAGKIVAVLPMLDAGGGVRRLGVLAAEEIERVLLDRKVNLVDRQHLNALLGEKDLQIATLTEGKGIAKAVELTGADILIVGRTVRSGQEVLISAKALSVQTGRPIVATRKESIPADGLGQLMWYVRRPSTIQADGELPPLALRYELVSPGRGGDSRLGDGATVRNGQKFKIRIQPNSDCHLYVLLYDSQGRASVLFPHQKIGLSNSVRGGVSYEIPEATKWYWFDDTPGTETFYIVASYGPLSDLDGIVAKMQQAGRQDVQLASAAKRQIEGVITRGMTAKSSANYQPKGFSIQERGVGGVMDVGWGVGEAFNTQEIDNVVTGHATVVKKVTLQHR